LSFPDGLSNARKGRVHGGGWVTPIVVLQLNFVSRSRFWDKIDGFERTGLSNGPPDQRLFSFRDTISCPTVPRGSAEYLRQCVFIVTWKIWKPHPLRLPPSFPFPNGYAVMMILCGSAGSVAHNFFAPTPKAQQAKTTRFACNIVQRRLPHAVCKCREELFDKSQGIT
jgi:hypothetical protein